MRLTGNQDMGVLSWDVSFCYSNCLFPILATWAQLCTTFSSSFECLIKPSTLPLILSSPLGCSYSDIRAVRVSSHLTRTVGLGRRLEHTPARFHGSQTHIYQSTWFCCFSFLSLPQCAFKCQGGRSGSGASVFRVWRKMKRAKRKQSRSKEKKGRT